MESRAATKQQSTTTTREPPAQMSVLPALRNAVSTQWTMGGTKQGETSRVRRDGSELATQSEVPTAHTGLYPSLGQSITYTSWPHLRIGPLELVPSV